MGQGRAMHLPSKSCATHDVPKRLNVDVPVTPSQFRAVANRRHIVLWICGNEELAEMRK